MDRRLWGLAAVVAGLFAAAWIYMDLQERHWAKTTDSIRSQIDEVDSLTKPVRPDTPAEQVRRRSQSVAQRMRTLPVEQRARTDSLKRVIEQDNLLGGEAPGKR